jgi:hypothetical protein
MEPEVRGVLDGIGLRSLSGGRSRADRMGADMVAGVVGELSLWRAQLEDSWPVFWFALLGLVGCTSWTVVGRRKAGRWAPAPRVAAVLTIGFAVAWVLVDKHLEGPVLFVVSDEHGVTVSDLASVVAVLIAGWRLLPL